VYLYTIYTSGVGDGLSQQTPENKLKEYAVRKVEWVTAFFGK